MDLNVGSQAGDGNTVVGSRLPVDPSPPPTQIAGRKKGTSCARCRRQKIRCDDKVPSCGNCARAGQVCIRTHLGNNPDVISYINYTEARLRFLEDTLRRVAPEELAKLPIVNKPAINTANPYVNLAPTTSQSRLSHEPNGSIGDSGNEQVVQNICDDNHRHTSPSSASTTSPSGSAQIGPSEPLAHEVGLLSLANSRESKYLGPSSGVQFARLIFSAIPQSQGLAANWVTSGGVESQGVPQAQPFPLDWTLEVDLQHFVDAYFETLHPLHPFIDEDAVSDRLEILYKQTPGLDLQQTPQLSEIESTMYPLYSLQIFLIIALGARILETRLSADFSSDRYLAAAQARIGILGLPLHNSIEGLQVMLLLTLSSFYFENGPNAWFLNSNIIASCLDLGFQRRWTETVSRMSLEEYRRITHRKNIRSAIFWSAYSIERNLSVVLGRPLTLRDEAIDVEFPGEGTVSYPSSVGQRNETKLMLHRVVNLPERFPWPTDLVKWQKEARLSCDSILDEPTFESWKTRYNSAVKTIMIYSHLHHFSKLTNSWLTAHTVFVSGITFVYCIWAQPRIKNETSLEAFTRNATACTTLLTFLGRTWSVATNAVKRFERLVHMTTHSWRAGEEGSSTCPNETSEISVRHSSASQHLPGGDQKRDSSRTTSTFGDMGGPRWNEHDFEPMSFYTELGDVSAWFDLDWILIMNTGPSGEVMSYPAP
ncbi:hypothetical protein F5Y06DRAFT_286951 [Hypoxylon sp. FL0890]|nr:hypothetical protein F5Y06DRAFT_286951 [Hypoxylon sp. FL0890]